MNSKVLLLCGSSAGKLKIAGEGGTVQEEEPEEELSASMAVHIPTFLLVTVL